MIAAATDAPTTIDAAHLAAYNQRRWTIASDRICVDPDAIALLRLAGRSPSEREGFYVRQNVPGAVRAEVESLLRLADGRVDAPRDPVAAVARNLADDPDGSGGHSAPSTSAETRSPTV